MNTTTDTITHTLTRDDLTAMTAADSIVFRMHHGDQPSIRAIMRGDLAEPRIYTAREQRLFPNADGRDRTREIHTDGILHGYGATDGDPQWRGDDRSSAFEMIGAAQYDHIWQTIVTCLRVGDRITLDFSGDRYTNGYVSGADLHADALMMRVARDKGRELVFLVDVSVCADNSARTVRRHA
jgi:hypothetical protein